MRGTCPHCGYQAPQRPWPQHGENNPAAKLTAEKVMLIFKSPLPAKELADFYGVGVNAIWRIKNGRKWASITGAVYRPRKRK